MCTEIDALWLEIAERRQGAIKLTSLPAGGRATKSASAQGRGADPDGCGALIDILKKAVLRTGCLRAVTSVADRGALPEGVLAA